MTAVANLLLKAIHARLSGDAGLVAMTGANAIHDRLLERPKLPAILFAEMKTEDISTDADPCEEHALTLEVWTADQGRGRALEIAGRVRALLHDAGLVLSGARLVNLRHVATRSRREADTRRHVAEMRFRAVTE